MPKTKFQNFIFTAIMAFFMVYAMICYNISLNIGGLSNKVFLLAFHEMIIMCPIMSFIATLLFKNAGSEFISMWLQTTAFNFPVAIFWQLCYCGPLVRFIFRTIFKKQLSE